MKVGNTVQVTCTDTGKSQPGLVHRVGVDYLEVLLGPEKQRSRLIMRKKPNTKIFVGTALGLEFTVPEVR